MKVLKDFIFSLKQRQSLVHKSYNYVLTNVSCDMDSVVSSILLSFAYNIQNLSSLDWDNYFQNEDSEEKSKKVENNQDKHFFIPLINCKKSEFKFRLDLVYLFKVYNINYEHLFFIDEFNLENHFKDEKLHKIILVDHNKLDFSQSNLSNNIIEIIDHHDDSGDNKYPNLKEKFIKYPLGSCSTLILLNYYLTSPLMLGLFRGENIDFLVSAILQDSENFHQQMYKWRWVDLDKYVFDKICEIGTHSEDFYKNISDSKFDLKSNLDLGIENLMVKDKKTFVYTSDVTKNQLIVEWSSLQVNYRDVVDHFSKETVLNYFKTKDDKIDIYITSSNYGLYNKIAGVYISNKAQERLIFGIRNFIDEFKNVLGKDFLTAENITDNFYSEIIIANNYTRKNLEPIIKDIFISKFLSK